MQAQKILAGVCVIVLMGFYGTVQAQSGGGYDLFWNTIDGGGGTFSTGGGSSVSGR